MSDIKKEINNNDKENSLSNIGNGFEDHPHTDLSIFLRSCKEEILNPLDGEKFGTIPSWLSGTLLRNGPGSLQAGNYEFKHVFDGSALLHRFHIENGNVTYQCSYVKSEAYRKICETKRIVFNEFGTEMVPDPCATILKRVASFFKPGKALTDNPNVSVTPFGDELYSVVEGVYAYRINAKTLETEERKNISKVIPMVVHHSAHPHVTQDGTVYNIALRMGLRGPVHHIVRFRKSMEESKSMFDTAEIVASVPARWLLHPSYMHTFGITDNYFIMVEQPFAVSVLGVMKASVRSQSIAGVFRWFDEERTIINIIERRSGQTYSFFTKAFFYFHMINQYEISNEYIVIDVCSYKDPAIIDVLFTENMRKAQKQSDMFSDMVRVRPLRFVLPLKQRSVSLEKRGFKGNLVDLPNCTAEAYMEDNGNINLIPEELCDISSETPQINYDKYCGKPYRYFYAISLQFDAEHPGKLIKVDTHRKTFKAWHERNCYPSEPVFFPSPNAEKEDDGVLLSSLVWGEEETNKVGLLILNASTLEEIGRVVFRTPGPVPKCVHGWFLPQRVENTKNTNN